MRCVGINHLLGRAQGNEITVAGSAIRQEVTDGTDEFFSDAAPAKASI